MSQPSATRARPLSPHLTIYRPPITMTMSIVHRITGAALYFGTLILVWWLVAASVSVTYYDFVQTVLASWLGRLVLFGYTWALLHHMLGGVRHLVWDTGAALEKHTASRLGWATLIGSVTLTLLLWVVAYAVRG
jgi:succinate dehydrogenase / fumarate reductase cytochrome b subunit